MKRPSLAKFSLTTILLVVFGLPAVADPAPAGEDFLSGCFAWAPEGAFDIANAPAPLFRDPVTDGAADPSVVWHAGEKAWYIFYTQRRANVALPPAESWYMGTKIAIAKSADQGRTWNYVGTAQGLSRGMKDETFWAPHVFEDNGTWHLFVTFIPKVVKAAKGQPVICHYTSKDMVAWEYSDTVDVKSDDIIDPGVVKLRDGRWLMVFRDCRQQNRTAKVVSPDLRNWTRLDDLTGTGAHEAPVVLFWKNKFWMFIDEWKGIGAYESDDGIKYTQNSLILDKAGKRADDGYFGSHPGVALAGDRAFVFYHVHAGRKIGVDTPTLDQKGIEFKRTSLQVAELELKDGKIICDRDNQPAPVRFIENLAAGKSQTIVTMGTSLTKGGNWVPQMKDLLEQKYPNLAKVVNLGRDASSTAAPKGRCGLDMVKAVVAAKPDAVFIEYGMNDCYLRYQITPEQSATNLNTIIDTILAASPQTEVILQTMNSCKDYPEKNPPWLHASNRPKLADYYQIHRDIARKRNLRLIDHYPAWLAVMNNDPARFDKLVPDRIHPNAEGAREIIMPTLIKELGL